MNEISTIRREFSRVQLAHDGRAGELWPIVLKNALLNLLTLTFYRFWGKTNVRRFLWRNTTLNGEPFEYTGTGKELFIGFLIVFFLVLLPLIVAQNVLNAYLLQLDRIVAIVGSFGFYAIVLFLIGLAIYRARRYRLTRTAWRGIRGGMAGDATAYAWRYLAYFALSAVTLGLAYPVGRMRLFGRLMRETTFGQKPFGFDGSAWRLYPKYLLFWVPVVLAVLALIVALGIQQAMRNGDVPTVFFAASVADSAVLVLPGLILIYGLVSWVWYRVRELQHFATCSGVANLSFAFDATSWSLVRLVVGNMFIVLLTLGFGLPFTQMRTFRYACDRLSIDGTIDVDAVVQSSAQTPSYGEGLADAFDMGAV